MSGICFISVLSQEPDLSSVNSCLANECQMVILTSNRPFRYLDEEGLVFDYCKCWEAVWNAETEKLEFLRNL